MNDSGSDKLAGLTHGGVLARNIVFNLAGQGAPMLAAVVAIPWLIKGLGTDRFGVLTLVWLVMGYFSLFDLGLGRALTQLVSAKLGAAQHEEIPATIWTALLTTLVMGLVGATILSLSASWLVRSALKIPLVLQAETLSGFYLMALSLPLVISTASLRGILEAHQRFDLTNAVGGITGVFSFLVPLLALSFSHQLPLIVGCLLAGRLISWGANLLLCLRVIPSLRHGIIFKRALLKPLISFGGWMTVSNIVGPLMVYLDRFLIGALVSIAAVAYYATPYELVTKLWLIPGALAGVLFPAISASYFTDRGRVTQLFHRGVKYVFLIMVPLSLIIVTLAHEGLQVWLGFEFAEKSTVVLQWLAFGVLINSLALMPLAMLQGAGRPDLTGKLHLLELPVYLVFIIWALKAYGIEGAAFAWVLRVGLDAALLFYLTKKILPSERLGLRNLSIAMTAVLITFSLASLLTSLAIKSIFLGLTLIAFASTAWFLILSSREKAWMRNHLKVLKPAIIGRSFDR